MKKEQLKKLKIIEEQVQNIGSNADESEPNGPLAKILKKAQLYTNYLITRHMKGEQLRGNKKKAGKNSKGRRDRSFHKSSA